MDIKRLGRPPCKTNPIKNMHVKMGQVDHRKIWDLKWDQVYKIPLNLALRFTVFKKSLHTKWKTWQLFSTRTTFKLNISCRHVVSLWILTSLRIFLLQLKRVFSFNVINTKCYILIRDQTTHSFTTNVKTSENLWMKQPKVMHSSRGDYT